MEAEPTLPLRLEEESCDNPMAGIDAPSSSSSSSSSDEDTPMDYFAGYETMPCGLSDGEDEEGIGQDYIRLCESEGLQYIIRSVPLGSRIEPFAAVVDVVEQIVILRPLKPAHIVDIDTLVVRPADRTVLGKVIEVFGPIESPLYSVICHAEHLTDGSIAPGVQLGYLPDQASLVQTEELRRQKITDADDALAGEGEEFYSDDEAEAVARRQRKPKRKTVDLEPGEIAE